MSSGTHNDLSSNMYVENQNDPSALSRHRQFLIEQLRKRQQQQRQQQGPMRQPGQAVEVPRSAAELSENDSWMRLTVDLPGVLVEDLDVSVHNGVLTVQATRRTMSVDESVCIKKQKISRRYAVDTDVIDVSNIKANLAHGVLTIKAPKRSTPGYVRIKVSGTNEKTNTNTKTTNEPPQTSDLGKRTHDEMSSLPTTDNVPVNQQHLRMSSNISDEGNTPPSGISVLNDSGDMLQLQSNKELKEDLGGVSSDTTATGNLDQ